MKEPCNNPHIQRGEPRRLSSPFISTAPQNMLITYWNFYIKKIGVNGFKWIKLVFFYHHLIKSVGFFFHDVPLCD